MFGWEFKRNIKSTFIHILAYGIIIVATVLFIRFFDIDGIIADRTVKMLKQTPDMIMNSFMFLKSEIMESHMKAFLFLMLLLFLPFIHYAMLLPVRSFERDEDYGTISYVCNGIVNRKNVFISKVLSDIVNYIIMIFGMTLLSELVLVLSCVLPEHRRVVAIQVLYIYLAIFVVGITMMSISVLYVSLKNKRSNAEDFIFSVLQCLVLIRVIPFMLSFVEDILYKYGRNMELIKNIINRLENIFKWIFLFWANPLTTYIRTVDLIQIGICLGISICFFLIGFLHYRYREFGE